MDNLECTRLLMVVAENVKKRDLYSFAVNMAVLKNIARGIDWDTDEEEELVRRICLTEIDGLEELGQYEHALEAIEDSWELLQESLGQCELEYKKGVILARLGYYQDAIVVLEQLLKEAWTTLENSIFITLSWIYIQMYQQESVNSYLNRAEYYCEELIKFKVEPEFKARVLRNLADVHYQRGDDEKALATLLEASTLYEDANLGILTNIASICVSMQKPEQALQYIEKAEGMALEQEDGYREAECYFNRGRLEEEVYRDYIQAKDYYLSAFDKFNSAHKFGEALKVWLRIEGVDRRMAEESYRMMAEQLGVRLETLNAKPGHCE